MSRCSVNCTRRPDTTWTQRDSSADGVGVARGAVAIERMGPLVGLEDSERNRAESGSLSLLVLGSLLALVDHHVRLGDANELRHRLLHMEVLDLVPLLRRLVTIAQTAYCQHFPVICHNHQKQQVCGRRTRFCTWTR